MTALRQAHAEFTEDGILVLLPDSAVEIFPTPEKAIAAVRAADRRAAKKLAAGAMVVTALTWHNTPEGFEVPS